MELKELLTKNTEVLRILNANGSREHLTVHMDDALQLATLSDTEAGRLIKLLSYCVFGEHIQQKPRVAAQTTVTAALGIIQRQIRFVSASNRNRSNAKSNLNHKKESRKINELHNFRSSEETDNRSPSVVECSGESRKKYLSEEQAQKALLSESLNRSLEAQSVSQEAPCLTPAPHTPQPPAPHVAAPGMAESRGAANLAVGSNSNASGSNFELFSQNDKSIDPEKIFDSTGIFGDSGASHPQPPPTQPQPTEHPRRGNCPLPPSNSAEFEIFWKAYPRKTGKQATRKAWDAMRNRPECPALPALLASVEAHQKTDQWQSPQFIPHPATYLNQSRFEDDVTTESEDAAIKAAEERCRQRALEAARREYQECKALPWVEGDRQACLAKIRKFRAMEENLEFLGVPLPPEVALGFPQGALDPVGAEEVARVLDGVLARRKGGNK